MGQVLNAPRAVEAMPSSDRRGDAVDVVPVYDSPRRRFDSIDVDVKVDDIDDVDDGVHDKPEMNKENLEEMRSIKNAGGIVRSVLKQLVAVAVVMIVVAVVK